MLERFRGEGDKNFIIDGQKNIKNTIKLLIFHPLKIKLMLSLEICINY